MDETRERRRGIGVAVIGCGVWGRNHVRNYAELGALRAVVDRDAAAASALGERHGVPAGDLESVLADPAVDALVLALPPSQNLAVGMRALGAGKHIFVEKPMALTTPDATALAEAADRLDRRLMVGHILQYHPAFLALRDLVRAGRLGDLLSIVSTRLALGRIRREEDALWALAPHDLSMILALAGGEPETVGASGGRHTHPTIADTATVALGFPGRLGAEIRVSWLHPFKEQRLVVVGRDGTAVFDDVEPWERKLVVYPHRIGGGDGVPRLEPGGAEPVAVAPGEPLRRECEHFLDCVATGIRPRTDGAEGLRVLAVLEQASAAMAATAPG